MDAYCAILVQFTHISETARATPGAHPLAPQAEECMGTNDLKCLAEDHWRCRTKKPAK